MATKLGKIGITLEGVYDPTKEYDKLSCVIYNGESWVSRVSVPAGNAPGTSTFWQKFSERGERGEQGPQGEVGPKGTNGLRGPQGNSGYTGAADELEVVNNLETNNAIAALSAAQGYILNAKLAQLDQEWQEIKDANFQVTIEVLPHIEKVMVEGGAAILQPDKFYDFGEVAQIALDFAPVADAKNAAVYAFQFKSPADAPTTITMPDNIKFPAESDSMFTIKAGRIYQVNVVDGLASASSWEA